MKDIYAGKIYSSRHEAFNQSARSRQALFYTMITDPCTDDQLEWTFQEISKIWLVTKKDKMDNNSYCWTVILAETFIEIYSNFFQISTTEALGFIRQTPLHKKGCLKEFMEIVNQESDEESD